MSNCHQTTLRVNKRCVTTKKKASGRLYGGVDSEARATERRLRLIKAGLKVFGTKGFHAATVREICRTAELTERYFYESFESSEALLWAVYGQIIDDLKVRTLDAVARVEPKPELMARAALTVYFETVQKDRRAGRVMLFEVLGVSREVDRRYRKAMGEFAELLQALAGPVLPAAGAQKRGNPELIATGLVGASVHIAVRWMLNDYAQPLEDVVESALAVFLAVLAMPAGAANGRR